ncbi:MAG: hypothetical protein LUH10_02435 [Tannerellaceae bacterium]|nr:hypothetical protein [Tannerellaceae bacterium]
MKSAAYQLFLEILNSRVPDKKTLLNELKELLCIEKEAVYRRLRQEVLFSFPEIVQISRKYHISLDQITGNLETDNLVFYLVDYDFLQTPPEHLALTEECIRQVASIKNYPDSEAGFAMNTIPLTLVNSKKHRNLYCFAVYKWMYQYGKYTKLPSFKDFTLPGQLLNFNDLYAEHVMHTNYTYYIFDENMIASLIKDILYFRMIRFITQEDIDLLKVELLDFLRNLENIAVKGQFPTGKKVDFFITRMTIESSFSYIDSDECHFTFLKLFSLNDVSSGLAKNVPRIKEWLQSLKKSSSQISVSGELQRIKYFEKQREIINQL